MIRKKRIILYGIVTACLAGLAVSSWNIVREQKPRAEAENAYEDIRRIAFPDADRKGVQTEDSGMTAVESRKAPDFAALKARNPDICGWVYVPGTDLDYPVVQGSDNEYYLNHTADRKQSVVGSVFMESRNQPGFTDDVTVLYGHHIKGGRMFSSLSGYKKQSFYESHPRLYLYTPEGNYRVELFAGRILDGEKDTFPLVFPDGETREEWIGEMMEAATFKSPVRPEAEERILVLCTCTYEYEDARFAVYGVMRSFDIENRDTGKENAG